MTIAFKELAGSPVETFGPEGMKAQRMLLCAWDDRRDVVEQLLGDGHAFGGRSRARYPDSSDVVAMRIRSEPFGDDVAPQVLAELTEGLNRYKGFAKITVDYQLLMPAERSNLPEAEAGTFLAYRQSFSGERMRMPVQGLIWQSDADVPVLSEAFSSLHVPLVEHHVTWHRVVRPPWEAVRSCAGTVNSEAFLGAPAAAVLLQGAAAEREFLSINGLAKAELAWRIAYVFLEKVLHPADGGFAGWNHGYRSLPADNPGWDELADANGNRPYRSSDFTQLFQYSTADS